MKSKRYIKIYTNFVKLGISKIIGHVNETIGHINESIQSVELESNKKMTMFMDNY